MKSSLRNKYVDLKVLIIGKMFMVSNDFLFNTHLRLVEISGCQSNKAFAGLLVVTIGKLTNCYQYEPDQSICAVVILGKVLSLSGGNLK